MNTNFIRRARRSFGAKRIRACASALALGVVLTTVAYLCSCDGGGGAGLAGASTIRGVVATYNGQGTAWIRSERPSIAMRIFSRIADLLVPDAMAAVEGVGVAVEGTDLSTTTAADGMFIISGVPPGQRTILFSLDAQAAAYNLDVQPNTIIDLRNIHIKNEDVAVERVDVTEEHGGHEGVDDGSNDNGGSSAGEDSSSGSSSEDNGSSSDNSSSED